PPTCPQTSTRPSPTNVPQAHSHPVRRSSTFFMSLANSSVLVTGPDSRYEDSGTTADASAQLVPVRGAKARSRAASSCHTRRGVKLGQSGLGRASCYDTELLRQVLANRLRSCCALSRPRRFFFFLCGLNSARRFCHAENIQPTARRNR